MPVLSVKTHERLFEAESSTCVLECRIFATLIDLLISFVLDPLQRNLTCLFVCFNVLSFLVSSPNSSRIGQEILALMSVIWLTQVFLSISPFLVQAADITRRVADASKGHVARPGRSVERGESNRDFQMLSI